jgi:hypothetical protein
MKNHYSSSTSTLLYSKSKTIPKKPKIAKIAPPNDTAQHAQRPKHFRWPNIHFNTTSMQPRAFIRPPFSPLSPSPIILRKDIRPEAAF